MTIAGGHMQAPPTGTMMQVLVVASQVRLPRHVSLVGSHAAPGKGRAAHVVPTHDV